MTVVRSGSASDVGRVRSANEDRLLEAGSLFAVADGMGGHAGGEVAAGLAIEVLQRRFGTDPTARGLVDAVRRANLAVWERSHQDAEVRGMGTTLTAAALVPTTDGDRLVVANVGDSRAYRFAGDRLVQMTTDHSVAEELVARGELSEAEAAVHPHRHILTRALGVAPDVDVDAWELSPREGERFLLCSDGLTNEVSEERIAAVLHEIHDPGSAAEALVDLANEHGGSDNITVVILDVLVADPPTGASSPARASAGRPAQGGAAERSAAPGAAPGPDGAATGSGAPGTGGGAAGVAGAAVAAGGAAGAAAGAAVAAAGAAAGAVGAAVTAAGAAAGAGAAARAPAAGAQAGIAGAGAGTGTEADADADDEADADAATTGGQARPDGPRPDGQRPAGQRPAGQRPAGPGGRPGRLAGGGRSEQARGTVRADAGADVGAGDPSGAGHGTQSAGQGPEAAGLAVSAADGRGGAPHQAAVPRRSAGPVAGARSSAMRGAAATPTPAPPVAAAGGSGAPTSAVRSVSSRPTSTGLRPGAVAVGTALRPSAAPPDGQADDSPETIARHVTGALSDVMGRRPLRGMGTIGAPGHAGRRRSRRVTFRVVFFVLLVAAVAAAAGYVIHYYADDAWFVRLDGNRVAVYQGRPGGFLGFQPKVRQVSDLTSSDVLSYRLPQLRAGVQESSQKDADRFVANLRSEYCAVQPANPVCSSPPGSSRATPAVGTTGGGGSSAAGSSAAGLPAGGLPAGGSSTGQVAGTSGGIG